MLHWLTTPDTNLFLWLNGHYNTFWDGFMSACSAKLTWIPLYLSVLYVIIRQWKRDAIWVILAVVLCVLISDQVASSFFKEFVRRPRPSHADELQGLVHLVNNHRGSLYGFASSHASNTFGLALVTSFFFKRRLYTILIFCWALLVAYSRIYLGVHYPLDIFGGMVVGAGAALFCRWLLFRFHPVEDGANCNFVAVVGVVLTLTLLALLGWAAL